MVNDFDPELGEFYLEHTLPIAIKKGVSPENIQKYHETLTAYFLKGGDLEKVTGYLEGVIDDMRFMGKEIGVLYPVSELTPKSKETYDAIEKLGGKGRAKDVVGIMGGQYNTACARLAEMWREQILLSKETTPKNIKETIYSTRKRTLIDSIQGSGTRIDDLRDRMSAHASGRSIPDELFKQIVNEAANKEIIKIEDNTAYALV